MTKFFGMMKVEITEVHWWGLGDTEASWEYKLRRNDGRETDYLLEGNLRPAPKFKVGDKVVMDVGLGRMRLPMLFGIRN